jgi:hypothetical protein
MGMNGPSEARRLVGVRVAAEAARRAQAEADELAIAAWARGTIEWLARAPSFQPGSQLRAISKKCRDSIHVETGCANNLAPLLVVHPDFHSKFFRRTADAIQCQCLQTFLHIRKSQDLNYLSM